MCNQQRMSGTVRESMLGFSCKKGLKVLPVHSSSSPQLPEGISSRLLLIRQYKRFLIIGIIILTWSIHCQSTNQIWILTVLTMVNGSLSCLQKNCAKTFQTKVKKKPQNNMTRPNLTTTKTECKKWICLHHGRHLLSSTKISNQIFIPKGKRQSFIKRLPLNIILNANKSTDFANV